MSETADIPPVEVSTLIGTTWGDQIEGERKKELWARLRSWLLEHDHREELGPFEEEHLTGADVFWLAVYTLAGQEADVTALTNAEYDVRRVTDDILVPFDITLSSLPLQRANLSEAQLQRAHLSAVQLQGVDLTGAQLQGAILAEARLQEADLASANLEGTILSGAQLQGVNLSWVRAKGADLTRAQLQRANLNGAQLEQADLAWAHLEEANLSQTQLERANLDGAHLEGTYLAQAQLKEANLTHAHLQRADLFEALLEGANLEGAQLEGANLTQAQLEGANLTGASLDKASRLYRTRMRGVFLDQVVLDRVNLSVVAEGTLVLPLGDETRALAYRDNHGNVKARTTRLYEFQAAVRANRLIAVAFQEQGMMDEAAAFAYRAQVLQCKVFRTKGWRFFGRYLFSAFLDLIAGYGYRPMRSAIAYLLLVMGFASVYYGLGVAIGPHLSIYEACVVSLTAFHGRGFFATAFQPADPQAGAAAVEAVLGLLIEISFIATFTQRFFGSK